MLHQHGAVIVDLLDPAGKIGFHRLVQFARRAEIVRLGINAIELDHRKLPLHAAQISQQQVAVAPEHLVAPIRLHLLKCLVGDAPGRLRLGEERFRPTQHGPLGGRMCIAGNTAAGVSSSIARWVSSGMSRRSRRSSSQRGGKPVTVSTPRTNSSLKSRLPARISFMYDGEKLIMRAILAPPADDPASTFRLARHTRYSVSSKSSMG